MDPGETLNVAPDPTDPTPQLEEYHCQAAPVPSAPPATLNVVELPEQIGFTDAEALVAAVEFVLTVIITLTHAVVLQVPSART